METLERWFGAAEDWEREATPRQQRTDRWLAVATFIIAALGLELIRAAGSLEQESWGVTWQYTAVASGCALISLRRVAPVLVMLLAAAHFVVAGQTLPVTMATLPMQLVEFFLLFSGVAWARERRAALLTTGVVVVVMALWLAWWFALGSGMAQMREVVGEEAGERFGIIDPVTGLLLYSILVNIIYFGFAIGLGLLAWRGGLQQHRAHERAVTIEAQASRLRDQAVVDERLRIARELHDVVAHHVSVMGVQAAAARRVMSSDADAAQQALATVESSSRNAVGQMRDLLGTLRNTQGEDGGGPASGGGGDTSHRSPQPMLADLPMLASEATTPTCTVTVDVIEAEPGCSAEVPPPVQLSVYRVVQEAFANVHRHSTARRARAVVRIGHSDSLLEVEIVDDGAPRGGTSGTGLGLRGMRERAEHLGGGVEAGPRTGHPGWRVRVWFPLDGRGRMPS